MSFMCHNKRRSRPIEFSEDDKRQILAMVEKTMNDQDRIDAAEKAAAEYAPVVSDPGMIRFARRCFADGYELGILRAADMDLIKRAHERLSQTTKQDF